MANPDQSNDTDSLDNSSDPDLDAILAHASRDEVDAFLALARRLLEADDDPDRGHYPPGELLVQGVLAAATAAHVVGGDSHPVFTSSMGFVLSDRHSFAARAWRLLLAMPEREMEELLDAARRRAAERREREIDEGERGRSGGAGDD